MSGDHCILRREQDGRAIAIHYDCDDYPDGTITDVLSGEVIR